MNNKQWVFRIAKNSFYGIGPYGFLMNEKYKEDGLTEEDIKPLLNVLYSKERWTGHVYQKTIRDVLKKYPVFEKQGCMSSFKVHRPGPWDDPVLKQSLYNKYGNRENLSKQRVKWHGFGFDSFRQLYNWFDDDNERKILEDFGFKLHKEKIKTEHINFGLKQVYVIIDK